jgi:dTDP-4-dehydrorhamnose reductase
VLIIGITGFLGSAIKQYLSSEYQVFGTTNNGVASPESGIYKLDATNHDDVMKIFLLLAPDIVINCAGFTNVNQCESNPEASWILNTTIPFVISRYCSEFGSKFIQISTDHFESASLLPRTEDQLVWPINNYGNSKLEAEKIVIATNPTSMIIRTNFIGWSSKSKHSLLNWIVKTLESGETLIGFEDTIFSPVSVQVLSTTISELIELNYSGVINVSSDKPLSKYEFAVLVASSFNFSRSLIVKGLSAQVAQKAVRPQNLALDNGRLTEILGHGIPKLEDMMEQIVVDVFSQIEKLSPEGFKDVILEE